jgi:hypothetical protein
MELLDQPGTMYRRSGESVRAILNRSFFTRIYVDFTRIYVDARKVTMAELREPFDVLTEAYRLYKTRTARTYRRAAPVGARGTMRSAAPTVRVPHDRSALIDSFASVFDRGWSKTVMVELWGCYGWA